MNASLRIRDSIALIKHFRTSGTVTPSSPALISNLLSPIDFSSARHLIELGPGNGCVTEALLSRMHPDAILISLELNNEFVRQLDRIEDSRLQVHNACASTIRSILDDLSIDAVDHVISSLPLALIEDEVVGQILNSVNANLKTGGRFLQYQYSLKNYGDMKDCFTESRVRFTLRNMPPAFVYECIK